MEAISMSMKAIFLRKASLPAIIITLSLSFLLLKALLIIPGFAHADEQSNKAARVTILQSSFAEELSGQNASPPQVFLVLETQWENIHPKQKIEKSKKEGKVDRTMGVGGFAGRKSSKKKEEYVDADVMYKINKFSDHAYLLADGLAFALHPATENIPGGAKLNQSFSIAKQGEVKAANFAFLIPGDAKNLAFQFFDYTYGHIRIPIQGDPVQAGGTGQPPGKILGQAGTDLVEFTTQALNFSPDYMGKTAPEGWDYAVVQFSGKSLSGKGIRDIIQIQPQENTWLAAEGGYLYLCSESATSRNGFIRFTPEIYQYQEVAFLVPESIKKYKLGIRARNTVLHLELTSETIKGFPKAMSVHKDGDIMEIHLFGTRQEQGKVIIDLGIQSFYDRGGLEIQMEQQFFLLIGEDEHTVDSEATSLLQHHPPEPFVVPPGTAIRFELAFAASGTPTSIRYRGYESEGYLKF